MELVHVEIILGASRVAYGESVGNAESVLALRKRMKGDLGEYINSAYIYWALLCARLQQGTKYLQFVFS